MRLPGIVAISVAVISADAGLPALARAGGPQVDACQRTKSHGNMRCRRGSTRAARSSAERLAPARGGPFRNCAEARAAGAAPIQRGQPGYARHLDRDNDGIACE
jgi:hypothetical protein